MNKKMILVTSSLVVGTALPALADEGTMMAVFSTSAVSEGTSATTLSPFATISNIVSSSTSDSDADKNTVALSHREKSKIRFAQNDAVRFLNDSTVFDEDGLTEAMVIVQGYHNKKLAKTGAAPQELSPRQRAELIIQLANAE